MLLYHGSNINIKEIDLKMCCRIIKIVVYKCRPAFGSNAATSCV